jgi:hypothetical protein
VQQNLPTTTCCTTTMGCMHAVNNTLVLKSNHN